MNLHEETQTFKAAIQLASSPVEEGGLGINEVFLEKDYWICRSLKQLSRSKAVDVAVFKGGTSLSKAHNLGDRFSEDIDIAILNDRNLPENQTKKIIHEITKVMSQGLVEVLKPDTRKYSKYRKVYYEYPRVTENTQIVSVNSGQILLEVVSFANPYPYHKVLIKSFITEYLEKSGRVDVIENLNSPPPPSKESKKEIIEYALMCSHLNPHKSVRIFFIDFFKILQSFSILYRSLVKNIL